MLGGHVDGGCQSDALRPPFMMKRCQFASGGAESGQVVIVTFLIFFFFYKFSSLAILHLGASIPTPLAQYHIHHEGWAQGSIRGHPILTHPPYTTPYNPHIHLDTFLHLC